MQLKSNRLLPEVIVMSRTINFGIIGCGVISKTHIEQIHQIDKAVLVAVCDVDRERANAAAKLSGATAFYDVNEFLSQKDIDVVCILTPSGTHANLSIMAAKAGKHVIVEKPIDISIMQSQQMINICRGYGVKLSVISQHRFDYSTKEVKRHIDNHLFGNLVLCEAAVNWYRPQSYYDSGEWRGTWSLDGGGALMNQGVHTVDLMQYFMGPVESVFAHTTTSIHERIEVEDVAVATLKFKSGALGSLVSTTAAFPGLTTRIEVFGEKGSAVIENDQLTHLYQKDTNNSSHHYQSNAINLAAPLRDSIGTGSNDPGSISGLSHRNQLIDMIEAIQENREPLVNGEAGLLPLKIIIAIYESARTQRVISL